MLELIMYIALVGVAVWAITNFIPMPPQFKQIIMVIAAIGCVMWVLRFVGVFHGAGPTP